MYLRAIGRGFTQMIAYFPVMNSKRCNNLAPAYLCNLFAPRTPKKKKKIMLPKPRTDYLKRSFSYSGALLWNNYPEGMGTSNSLDFFKRSSHSWFSDQYSHTANM